MTKQSLGRGLESLLSSQKISNTMPMQEVAINRIIPNSTQPRSYFDTTRLQELQQSIEQYGILQPLLVQKNNNNNNFELIAGERRLRAAQSANFATVPVIIIQHENYNIFTIALIENIQRENLNPIEEARAYQYLLQELNITIEALSKQLGKSRSSISNTMRLLSLPHTVQNALLEGTISSSHARSMINIDEEQQNILLTHIIKNKISVHALEHIIKQIHKGAHIHDIIAPHHNTMHTTQSFAPTQTPKKNKSSAHHNALTSSLYDTNDETHYTKKIINDDDDDETITLQNNETIRWLNALEKNIRETIALDNIHIQCTGSQESGQIIFHYQSTETLTLLLHYLAKS